MASIRTYQVTVQFIGKDNKTYIREFVIAASNASDAKTIAYNRLPLYLTKSTTPIADNNLKFTILDNGIMINNKTYYSSPIFPKTYQDILPEPTQSMPIPPKEDGNTDQTAFNHIAMNFMLIWGRIAMSYILSNDTTTEQLYLAEMLIQNTDHAIDFCHEWANLYLKSNGNQDLEEFFVHTIQEQFHSQFHSVDHRNEQLDSDQTVLDANSNKPERNEVSEPERNEVSEPEDIPDKVDQDLKVCSNPTSNINTSDAISGAPSHTNNNHYIWVYDLVRKINIQVKKTD